MTFVDLSDFLDDDALPVTLRGKTYFIPSPSAETGLKLAAIANIGAKVKAGMEVPESQLQSLKLNDDDEQVFIKLVLGTAGEEMIADRISWVALGRIAQYAFTHFAISAETARKGLEAGVFAGKAQGPTAPNREARRAADQSARRASTGSSQPRRAQAPAASIGSESSSPGRS